MNKSIKITTNHPGTIVQLLYPNRDRNGTFTETTDPNNQVTFTDVNDDENYNISIIGDSQQDEITLTQHVVTE